jgi:AcrR family transcriptional regulator
LRKKDDLTRQKILENGKKLLLANNLSTFSMRQIAKSCDIGLGTIYNYFDNKEMLAYQIINDDWDSGSALINDVVHSDKDLRTKLKSMYEIVEAFLSCYLNLFYEVITVDDRKKTTVFQEEVSEMLLALIADERRLGNITNPVGNEELTQFIMMNFFYNMKNHNMDFNDLYNCIKFN